MKKLSIVIVGGGSTYTPALMKTLCNNKDTFPLRKIVLYDNDKDNQNPIGKFGEILFKEQYPELEEYIYITDMEEAFKDIDFAFMQIRSGGLEMRHLDEHIPLKNGCVGQETCGAGGISYGLRSIPDVVEIIKNIRKYSKEAWILNYSNPAAIVAEATRRVFPGDKRIINMCDMPWVMLDACSKIIRKSPNELSPRYFGLNHFGWFTNLYDQDGTDLLPQILDFLKQGELSSEDAGLHDESWDKTFKQLSQTVRDYDEDKLPSTYFQYYLYPNKMIKKLEPNYTRANEVIDGRKKIVFNMVDGINEKGTVEGSDLENSVHITHSQYIVDVASAIFNNENKIYLLIVENTGAIRNFPEDSMVEVACMVNSNGAEPLAVGSVGTFYKGLMEGQLASEKLAVDAYFEQDKQKLFRSLVMNRTVIDTGVAKKIVDELIDANKEYWPELK